MNWVSRGLANQGAGQPASGGRRHGGFFQLDERPVVRDLPPDRTGLVRFGLPS